MYESCNQLMPNALESCPFYEVQRFMDALGNLNRIIKFSNSIDSESKYELINTLSSLKTLVFKAYK